MPPTHVSFIHQHRKPFVIAGIVVVLVLIGLTLYAWYQLFQVSTMTANTVRNSVPTQPAPRTDVVALPVGTSTAELTSPELSEAEHAAALDTLKQQQSARGESSELSGAEHRAALEQVDTNRPAASEVPATDIQVNSDSAASVASPPAIEPNTTTDITITEPPPLPDIPDFEPLPPPDISDFEPPPLPDIPDFEPPPPPDIPDFEPIPLPEVSE